MAKVSKRTWTYKGDAKTAFVVRYTDQGGVRRQETFEKFKIADARRKEIENQIVNQTHVPIAETVSVAKLADLFLEEIDRRHHVKDRMGGEARAHYRNVVLRHIVPKFGGLLVTEFTAEKAQDWLDASSVRYKNKTIIAFCSTLDMMLKFAVRKRLVGRNVVIEGGVRAAGGARRKLNIPSLANLQHVLPVISAPRIGNERRLCWYNRRVAVGLALFTSMRRGEITGLQWGSVDLVAGSVVIEHSLSYYDGLKGTKTHAGTRTNALAPFVVEALRDLWEFHGRPTTGHVMRSLRGKRLMPSQMWDLWQAVAEKAGYVSEAGTPLWRFHDFRHAAASLLIAEGVTPLHVKTFMGHSSIQTTLGVYGHLFPEDTKVPNAVAAIAERLTNGARTPQKTLNPL